MGEGFTSGGTIAHGVHDDPESPPAAGPDAPRGWVWQRKEHRWSPRQRGPVLWSAGDGSDSAPAEAAAADGPRAGDRPQRDPDPSWMRDDGKKQQEQQEAKKRFDPKSVPAGVRDDIGGALGLAATVLLPPIERADPHCGGAIGDNFDRIIEKAIPLICRSERIVNWMQAEGGGFMDWLGLAIALGPVAKAVAEHHIVKTVEVVEEKDKETGEVRKIAQPVDFSQYKAA